MRSNTKHNIKKNNNNNNLRTIQHFNNIIILENYILNVIQLKGFYETSIRFEVTVHGQAPG